MSRDSSPSCAVGESVLSDDALAPSGSPQHFYATFEDKCTSGKGKVYAKHLSLLLDIGKQEREMGKRMDARLASEKWKEIKATIREKEECERGLEGVVEKRNRAALLRTRRRSFPKGRLFQKPLGATSHPSYSKGIIEVVQTEHHNRVQRATIPTRVTYLERFQGISSKLCAAGGSRP